MALEGLQLPSIKEFIEFLLKAFSTRREKQEALFEQAILIWNELDRTHNYFTESLRKVDSACQAAIEMLEKSDDTEGVYSFFASEINGIDNARHEFRRSRIARFEEAKAYLDFDWSEKHSIIKNIPDDLSFTLQSFML